MGRSDLDPSLTGVAPTSSGVFSINIGEEVSVNRSRESLVVPKTGVGALSQDRVGTLLGITRATAREHHAT